MKIIVIKCILVSVSYLAVKLHWGFKLTCWDIFPVDPDILVPVTPGMLMVEAERMEELMLNNPVFEAARHIQRDHLLPSVSADGRPAPAVQETTGWCILHITLTIITSAVSALTPVYSLSGGSLTAHHKERSECRFSCGRLPWLSQSGPSRCRLQSKQD